MRKTTRMPTCQDCSSTFASDHPNAVVLCHACSHQGLLGEDVDRLVLALRALAAPGPLHLEVGWPLATEVQRDTGATQKPGWVLRWSVAKLAAQRTDAKRKPWKRLSGPTLRVLLQAAVWYETVAAEHGDDVADEWYAETGGTTRPKGV